MLKRDQEFIVVIVWMMEILHCCNKRKKGFPSHFDYSSTMFHRVQARVTAKRQSTSYLRSNDSSDSSPGIHHYLHRTKCFKPLFQDSQDPIHAHVPSRYNRFIFYMIVFMWCMCMFGDGADPAVPHCSSSWYDFCVAAACGWGLPGALWTWVGTLRAKVWLWTAWSL